MVRRSRLWVRMRWWWVRCVVTRVVWSGSPCRWVRRGLGVWRSTGGRCSRGCRRVGWSCRRMRSSAAGTGWTCRSLWWVRIRWRRSSGGPSRRVTSRGSRARSGWMGPGVLVMPAGVVGLAPGTAGPGEAGQLALPGGVAALPAPRRSRARRDLAPRRPRRACPGRRWPPPSKTPEPGGRDRRHPRVGRRRAGPRTRRRAPHGRRRRNRPALAGTDAVAGTDSVRGVVSLLAPTSASPRTTRVRPSA